MRHPDPAGGGREVAPKGSHHCLTWLHSNALLRFTFLHVWFSPQPEAKTGCDVQLCQTGRGKLRLRGSECLSQAGRGGERGGGGLSPGPLEPSLRIEEEPRRSRTGSPKVQQSFGLMMSLDPVMLSCDPKQKQYSYVCTV
jgi:hypothetical protein